MGEYSIIQARQLLRKQSDLLQKSVGFFWYSCFLHQENWPPWYNLNIVESGVKHHNPSPYHTPLISIIYYY
jgi:hypothetical protein